MRTIEISSAEHCGMCFVCKSVEDNRMNIHYEQNINDKSEDCVSMFSQCYNINLADVDKVGEICVSCLCQLRKALAFRRLVEAADQQLSSHETQDDGSAHRETKNEPFEDVKDAVRQSVILDDVNINTTHTTQSLDYNKVVSPSLPDVDNTDLIFIKEEKKVNGSDPPPLEEGITVCPLCFTEEVTHEALKKHYMTHFPKFMCHICGRGMNSKGHYRIHLNAHNNMRYHCKQCDKVYKASSVLREHVKKHHENIYIQKYKCHKCPEKFVNYRTRKKHMFDKHGVACKKFACHLCDKSFFTQAGHRLHYKKIHLNIKDHVCNECGRGFGTQVELNLHMNSHSDVRNFSCDICGRRFKDKRTLKRHVIVHNKVKQFTCSYCDAPFAHRSNVLRHEKKQHMT